MAKKGKKAVISVQASEESDDDSDESEGRHNATYKGKKPTNLADYVSDEALQNPQSNRTDQINDKVDSIALKEKLKLAFYVLVVLVFLNSCLIACFYLGSKTFMDDSNTLDSLTTFYHRGNCLDNLMLYTIEQFIQNQTVTLDVSLES